MTKRFFLLLVIVFSVTGVKAQQTNIEDWAAYLSTAVPKEYFNYFFKSGGSIVKRIYYFKYKDEKYLALYEKGKLLNVKLAGEDYFQLLEQNYKDLKYNANNLLNVFLELEIQFVSLPFHSPTPIHPSLSSALFKL